MHRLTAILWVHLALSSCTTAAVTTAPDGNLEVHLDGKPAEIFRAVIGHDAITPAEAISVYGGDDPASDVLLCHEQVHREQARQLREERGLSKAAGTFVWLGEYLAEQADATREGRQNEYEIEAREACP